MWHRLLTGALEARELLSTQDYVDAASNLLVGIRGIAKRYLRKWYWVILVVLAIAGIITWAAVHFAPTATDRTAAALVATASFFGVSWAGVRATLGRALRRAEAELWAAEVSAAVGAAATINPPVLVAQATNSEGGAQAAT
jgi:hypothetical protein